MRPRDEEIADRAYGCWIRKGRPDNTQVQDWLEAEAEVRFLADLAAQLRHRSLPESARLLQAIVDNSSAVIYVKDYLGRYLLVNQRYEAIFHISHEQVIGKTDYDLFDREKADAFRANDLQVLSAEAPLEFEEIVPHEGSLHTYISLKFPIYGSSPAPYAVCGISTDITERKQAKRRLVAQLGVTTALAQSADLHDAAPAILQAVCEALDWDAGALWDVDHPGNALRCVAFWQMAETPFPAFQEMCRDGPGPVGVGLAGRVWAGGEPVRATNIGLTANFPGAATALQEGLHGSCAFPIKSQGEILGVIELFSRDIRQRDEELLETLAGLGGQISQFIRRKQAENALQQRQTELRVAHRIQQGLLPRTEPSVPGFVIGGASRPAQETGGDYLDFIPLSDGGLGVAIGDASGHGVGAALMIAETRAYLRGHARTHTDPGEILTLVNRDLGEDLSDHHFVTLFFARLDPQRRTLTYASAGHCHGYILNAGGVVSGTLPSTGMPLGVAPEVEIPGLGPVSLAAGDLVLLLTDGIMEASADQGPFFGMERTLQIVRARRQELPARIAEVLFEEARGFAQNSQGDDMTAIVIKVLYDERSA